MVKKSVSKQNSQTSQENGRKISTSPEKTAKKKERKSGAMTTGELLSSSPKEVDVYSKKQNENELHLLGTPKSNALVNLEENQREGFRTPIVNIHIHVPPNSDSSSASPTVQPIIHLHFDESNKNHDTGSISSQKSMSERRIKNFSCVTSTDSRNISLDISDSSDINSINETNYTSPNENGVRQINDTNVDMCEVSNVSSSEISTDSNVRKETRNQVPAIKLINSGKQKSQKPLKCSKEDSNKIELDKDFESVYPKLQLKVKSLIKKKLKKVDARSNKKVEKKTNSKLKPLVQQERNNGCLRQLRSSKSQQQIIQSDKSDGSEMMVMDHIPEVIVINNSDSSIEKNNTEDEVKGVEKLKVKKKSSRKSSEKSKCVDEYRTDGTRICNNTEKKPKSLKPERARTRETIDRKCKTPSKEQHSDWAKKVAFAKACQLQPNVFAEKKMLVTSPVESKEAEKVKRKEKSKTSSGSIKNNKKKQEDDSLVSCETPKRSSMYPQRFSRVASSSSEVSGSKKQASKNRSLDSGSETDRNGEICDSEKGSKSKSRFETSVNSDEETQKNDSQLPSSDTDDIFESQTDSVRTLDLESRWEALLASGNSKETEQSNSLVSSGDKPETLSYGCRSGPSVLAEKEVSVDSKKGQGLKSESVTEFASVNSSEETQQNGSTGDSPERLSNDFQSQRTEIESAEKLPIDETKAQELKNKWMTAFASVNVSGKTQQNGSLVSCETPKRVSSYQHLNKRSSRETSDVESCPKAPNESQTSKDEVSTSEIEKNEKICTLTSNSCGEESLGSTNHKTLTLLAEGCNFSEILKKFREKHYKDKVKLLFPNMNKSNVDNHIPQDSGCVAKDSPLEDGEKDTNSTSDDVINVQTVKRNKEKEKNDKFTNAIESEKNSNPCISPKEPVNCFSSPAEELPQSIDPPVSPQERESIDETNRIVNQVPVTSNSNNIHLDNEENLNCDCEKVPGDKDTEKISDLVDVNETCCDSSLPGDETTPENNVALQEDNHEIGDCVNEFRGIKKKLQTLPDNELLKSESEINSDTQSSNDELENLRKEILKKCMAQYPGDSKQPEKTGSKLKTKRKGSGDLSTSDKSVKKMKQSKETNVNSKVKSSNKKVFTEDDYIPLNATGPTKFAVAPLDKLTPYRKHAAKDFKGNMLYGNRVKRFNSPKYLEVYKAKQNAARNSSH